MSATDEEIALRESEWLKKRAEEDRRREAAIEYQNDFCARFALKHEEEDLGLIRVRAEKKCRAIIEYLAIAPTEEDFTTGKGFWTKREDFTIACAFVSTKQGGLIGCVEMILRDDRNDYTSSEFQKWIWDQRYKHHKTAEESAIEEDYKRRREESLARSAEWQSKNSELRWAEYRELQAQVKHGALPDPVVDELVGLAGKAVKETDQQRDHSPDRRPTLAPPIPFSKELIGALERLKALDSKLEFEPGYGRLWAVWESPKKAHGKCKGFDLLAGKAREGRAIVTIRPGYRSSWWTGPDWTIPSLHLTQGMGDSQIALQQAVYNAQRKRFLLNCELRELGIAEILKFAGAPEETMLAGARLAKICCCCGRALTDPTSMALGIGPECIKASIWYAQCFNGWTKEQTEAYYLARQDALIRNTEAEG